MAIGHIVSGGQTGVDRAALDAALDAGVSCGGWCPRGRRAEDGPIPARYPLAETAGRSYRERTRRNVEQSDGTLVLLRGALRGGTAYTARCARALDRPLLVLRLTGDVDPAGMAAEIAGWADANGVATLNVAGPRASQDPGIGPAARAVLDALCAAIRRSA